MYALVVPQFGIRVARLYIIDCVLIVGMLGEVEWV